MLKKYLIGDSSSIFCQTDMYIKKTKIIFKFIKKNITSSFNSNFFTNTFEYIYACTGRAHI